MDNISLKDTAIIGKPAIFLEFLTIIICAIVIVIIGNVFSGIFSQAMLYWIPLIPLLISVIGIIVSRKNATGAFKNIRYVFIYYSVILVMIAIDILVCLWLGGDLLIVVRNWAILIGSASAVNVLVSYVPAISLRNRINNNEIKSYFPLIVTLAISFSVIQIYLSVLGLGLIIALTQIGIRRIVILPIFHIISRLNYGRNAKDIVSANHTLEYVAIRANTSMKGTIEEPDEFECGITGTALLKLPIFSGRLLFTCINRDKVTVLDTIVFLEQILAFSSPTMVVDSKIGLLHMSYVRGITHAEGKKMPTDALLENRLLCKEMTRDFMLGNRQKYIDTALKYPKAHSSCSTSSD